MSKEQFTKEESYKLRRLMDAVVIAYIADREGYFNAVQQALADKLLHDSANKMLDTIDMNTIEALESMITSDLEGLSAVIMPTEDFESYCDEDLPHVELFQE